MDSHELGCTCCLSRRGFFQAVGATAGLSLAMADVVYAEGAASPGPRVRKTPTVRGAFLYPPTAKLREAGYYSWPGSSFDAEGRQQVYTERIGGIAQKLGMDIAVDAVPLDEEAGVSRFIEEVKAAPPDGLLLIPFKKGHWPHVLRIVDETGVPTVIMTTLGVLLVDHINPVRTKPGVYLINSFENFEALENGMAMLRAGSRMRNSRLININGPERKTATIAHWGTELVTVPHDRFYEEFDRTERTAEVMDLAKAYRAGSKGSVEPNEEDVVEAARCCVALKRLIAAEDADAMMMNCLPGLSMPHRHVPPCMGFMTLRDEGIPAGCQSDLNATLSLMLGQYLFNRPGFQQNASMDTEANHYFGAHCTCPSRMDGPEGAAEPYILRSHAEAGWGCVPRVLLREGQDVTLAQYVSGEAPQMYVYTGKIVRCPEMPPAGGCRTNIEMTINEVADVCDVKGMHQAIFYGNHGRMLRTFCQLHKVQAVS